MDNDKIMERINYMDPYKKKIKRINYKDLTEILPNFYKFKVSLNVCY